MSILNVLEIQHVQQPVLDWADKYRVLYARLNLHGKTGFPDVLFFIRGGRPFLIEFKRPGKQLEPRQWYIMGLLLNLDYDVEAHNDPKIAITALRTRVEAARLSEGSCKIPDS